MEKGYVHIGSVTSSSINYCAAYVITKTHYEYDRDDPRRPFALHSRRPALGARYVERYSRFHRDGRKNYAVRPFGAGKVSLPRYYKEKYSQNLTETFWQPKLENGLKKVHLMRVSLSRISDEKTHVRIYTSITDID